MSAKKVTKRKTTARKKAPKNSMVVITANQTGFNTARVPALAPAVPDRPRACSA